MVEHNFHGITADSSYEEFIDHLRSVFKKFYDENDKIWINIVN